MSDWNIKEHVSVYSSPPVAGYIKIADSVFIPVKRKPFIVHRFMMRMFFGWKWVKDWYNKTEE